MAVVPCRKCGALTSSAAAECPNCGIRERSADIATMPSMFTHVRRVFLVAAALIAVSSTVSWGSAYRERVAAERLVRLRVVEAIEAQARERHRIEMVARADSLQRAMPRRRHRTVNGKELRNALGVVAAYAADSAAHRWVRSARAELLRRDKAAQATEARRARTRQRQSAPNAGAAAAAVTQLYEAPTPARSSGSVQVRGYYRKDGTYVRPHSRRRPRN